MTNSLDFASDNWAGVSQPVLDAIIAANGGFSPAYFGDDVTARMRRRFEELFECPLAVFPVPSGTAANGLCLEILAGRDGVVAGMGEAHIYTKEGPARAYFNDRARLLTLAGPNGKLTPEIVEAGFASLTQQERETRRGKIALSLTEGTDCGTLYTVDEVAALAAFARRHGAHVHMDGARFANAVASLGCAPADLTWRAGVDILSFGATKNGALGVDAIVIFNPNGKAGAWIRECEQTIDTFGYVFSKARFASAQLDAMITNGHWLDLARHANAAAARLAEGLANLPGVRLAFPREINEVFPILPAALDDALRAAGARFHPWTHTDRAVAPDIAPRAHERLVRFVTSFQTKMEDVDRLLTIARAATGSSAANARAAE